MPRLSFYFLPLLLIAQIFYLSGCGATEQPTEEPIYLPKVKTVVVAPGLASEIQVTGEIQAQKSVTMTAEVKADVAGVFVKNGDNLVSGQTLVTLDSSSVATSVSTAQSAYSNATSGVTQTGLSVEKNIDAARIALSTAEINLMNTLTQTAAARRQAQEALNAAKLNVSLTTSSAETGLENTIRSTKPIAQNAVTKCDEIIGVSEINRYANNAFENLLGALQFASKPEAEQAIQVALDALAAEPNNYSSARNLLQISEKAIKATLNVLNNSTTGAVFNQTALNGYIASINGQLSIVRGAISALDSAQSTLDSVRQDSSGQSQSIISAQASYEATLVQLNNSEAIARRTIESAKAALASAERGAALNRVGAQSSMDAALGGLQQAEINADKLTIRAPFSGKVSNVSIEIGDEVNPGTVLLTVEDATTKKIVAYLSGNDVRKVNVGSPVKFGKQSSAEISTLAPSADSVTKKYKVEIFTNNAHLKVGEFIRLHFPLGEIAVNDQRIFLPLNAINIRATDNFVWKIVNGQAVQTPITLGNLEGSYIEILAGLKFGDEVIVEGGRILDLNQNQLAVEITK